jgi:[ribosomal protein S5]-alanine N-acetyltransferase
MTITQTGRLTLRWLTLDDAPFILALLNDPGWLRFIGDKHVRTLDDARRYITDVQLAKYAELGFGMNLVSRRADGAALGVCGLVKRPALPHVDLGFAFLPEHRAQGYAREAAAAVLAHAQATLGLGCVLAITTSDNERSMRLLAALGFDDRGTTRLAADAAELRLFGRDATAAPTR